MTGTQFHICAALLASTALPAMAQDTPEAPAAAQREDAEIVVTARRREESIQDVPLSVQAFGAQALEERQIERLSDLTQIVPGLTVQAAAVGNAALTLAIRGQRQGLANIAYDAPVSVYADEIVQARGQGLNDAFFDLSSVQVLKGPQGTLFGRNTTGGAILLTSQGPKDEIGGYAEATLGTYGLFRSEGALNLPIMDGLALRVAGVRTRRGGYLDSPANGRRVDNQRTESWRVSLLLNPDNGPFENRLVVSGFHESDDGVAYKLLDRNPAVATTAGLAADLAFYRTADFWTNNVTVPPHGTHIKTTSVSNITTLDLGAVTLKNIFGYRKVRSDIFFDLDGTSFLLSQSLLASRQHQVSDEFQLLGKAFGDQLDYVAGVYYFREKGDEVQRVATLNPAAATNIITDYSVISRTAAVYGQGTFRPDALPGLGLTAGLRYTWDHKQLDSRSRTFGGTCRLLDADIGGVPRSPCFYSADADFSKLTYTLSADYKLSDKVLVYATHRYGYQAGGFTNSATRPSDFTPYRPQTVSDIELGIKASFESGELRGHANLAGFRGEFKDVQRLLRFTIISGGLSFPANRILNAASSKVQGLEFDTSLSYAGWLKFSLAYAFLDTGYDSYVITNNGVLQDYTRAGFSGSPRHSVNASLRVRLPLLGEVAETWIQADGSYQSKTYAEDTTNFDPVAQAIIPRSVLPGYGTINLRFSLDKIAGQDLDLSAWVRNLTNERYYTAGFDSYLSSGYLERLLGAPRTVGATLRYGF